MDGTTQGYREHFIRLLELDPNSKPGVYAQVVRSARVLNLNYALELLLSAGIATFGLVLNSPAVVIGAMLISPLMGPILSAGLAFAAADLFLGVKSFMAVAVSVLTAVLFSAALVWALPFQSPTAEILARIQPNLLDLGVALLSGLAGSLVVCRGGGSGGVTALPGVAIAVALMPPLCTVGFGVGSGWNWTIISGAGLLFLTNLVAIGASAFVVFYLAGMDSKQLREAVASASRDEATTGRFAFLIEKVHMQSAIGDIGKLRWRVIMLAATLVLLFVPLRNSLYQLAAETIGRSAAREAVRSFGVSNILTEQVDIQPEGILIRLVVAESIAKEKIDRAERSVIQRTGKQAKILVRKVAGEEELALLRDRLRQPQRVPPPVLPPSLSAMGAETLNRVTGPLKQVWPAGAATMLFYEFGWRENNAVLRISYESPRPLEDASRETIQRSLRARLETPDLELLLDWHRPKRVRKPAR